MFRAISYENIIVAFLILPIGIILALITLFMERIRASFSATSQVQQKNMTWED
jgi:hypothetical protein